MTKPPFSQAEIDDIAGLLLVHYSVVENFLEEWEQQTEDGGDETFFEFLCRTFADAAFAVTATLPDMTAVDCLEAYDQQYTELENLFEEAFPASEPSA